MGKFDFYIDPNFLKKLGRLAEVEKVVPKMIDGAMPILTKNVKDEIGKHKRTGNMEKSVKATKAKRKKNGVWYAVVRPTGTTTEYMDKYGHVYKRKAPYRNMAILAHIEYGTEHIPPTPILTKALKDSRHDVYAKMAEVFKEEMNK